MKLNKNYIQTFIFLLVYLFGIYFWSQPYQERKLPYGEYDAMSHFEIADWMAYNDKSLVHLPHYIDLRYGNDNKFMPHTLWYAPTFHSTLGFMEIIGGDRVIPAFLMNTILATFIIVTAYFVINSLFGFLPAIFSAFLLIFSPRDFMPYLWGQWPERFAYAFIPIILYCFYKYFISYSMEERKPMYLYFTALFLGIQLLVHPLTFFHSAIGLTVLYIFLAIKQKKFVFNWKHITIAALIFILLFMMFPYQTFNIFPQFGKNTESDAAAQRGFSLSRLFEWSLNPADYVGSVPENYFSFKEMNGFWTLPFLLLGILFLAWRREEKDLLLLAWLISLYLVLHRDLIGKTFFLHRSLSATAHIFVPLAALGAVYAASAVKLPFNYNKYLKYGLAVVFVYFAITVNYTYAYKSLNKETYNDFFGTLNQQEFQAANWALQNIPASHNLTVLGIPYTPNYLPVTAKKIRWFAAVSQHVSRFYYLFDKNTTEAHLKNDYVVLDYTMVGPMKDRGAFDNLQQFEKTDLANHTLIYDQNYVRMYKYGTK